jgi:transposase
LHDAKAATLIAKLHLSGASEAWPLESDHERRLAAALRVLEVHEKEVRRNRGRLEGYLARHWPEVTAILSLDSVTLLDVLIEYGGPSGVAADAEGARALMRSVGGRFLAQEKIDAVVESALVTFGVPQIDEERRLVKEVAQEARRQGKAAAKARRRVEELATIDGTATEHMAPVVGKTTAAVLVAGVGDPRRYESASAFEKALGLNLKEKSSGKKKGGLHITKRGPGVARLFLYLAVLRLLQRDDVVRAWYAKKVKRDAGRKQKALIALMRKLSRGLWHVAAGNHFDSEQLFDARRLGLAT